MPAQKFTLFKQSHPQAPLRNWPGYHLKSQNSFHLAFCGPRIGNARRAERRSASPIREAGAASAKGKMKRILGFELVPGTGLEPAHLTALASKTSVSAIP